MACGPLDFTLTERSPERVVAEMMIQEGIDNPFGVVHAEGAIDRMPAPGAAQRGAHFNSQAHNAINQMTHS